MAMANNNNSRNYFANMEVFKAYQAAQAQQQQHEEVSNDSMHGHDEESSFHENNVVCDNDEFDENTENSFIVEAKQTLNSLRTSKEQPQDILQLLVAEVQSFICLWNRSSPEYKLSNKKKLAWVKYPKI